MPDQDTGTETQPAEQPQEGDEAKTFDADYVKKLRDEAAKYRTEAKANADAAKRLAEIEEANQTEAEKQANKLAEAQREAEAAKAEALRYRVATKFQVSDEDAELFLTGTDEETLTKQAQRLAERTDQQKKSGNYVPREGNATKPKEDEMSEFTRQLFEGARAQ